MPLFRLGRATLHTATSAEHLPRVGAVLVLGRQLRQRGLLLELALGAELTADVARWSRSRGVPLPSELDTLAPRVAEIHGGLAREVACLMQAHEQLVAAESWSSGPPFGLWRAKRELRVYKDFHGRLIEQLHPLRNDWRRMAEMYQDAVERRPKSLLLEATLVTPSFIESIGQKIDAFGAPQGPSKKD